MLQWQTFDLDHSMPRLAQLRFGLYSLVQLARLERCIMCDSTRGALNFSELMGLQSMVLNPSMTDSRMALGS